MSDWKAHMNWLDIVREEFPDATTKQALDILWNHTSYPEFEGPDDHHRVEHCRQDLREYVDDIVKRLIVAGVLPELPNNEGTQ